MGKAWSLLQESIHGSIYMKEQAMETNTTEQIVVQPNEIITYNPDGSVQIHMDNILTSDQVIFPGMLLFKSEGIHIDVVRILEIWDKDGYLYIKIEDNKTGKIGTISKRIGIDYHLWTLVSYDYLADKFIFKNLKKGTEIEFDFW